MTKDYSFFIPANTTKKDLQYLNYFLTAKHDDANPLNLTQTHGFLCAIASAPCLIMPSKYQPILLGGYPDFQSMGQAQKIFNTLSSLYNNANNMLEENKYPALLLWEADNVVDYDEAPLKMVEDWCKGYLQAVELDTTWRSDKKALLLLVPFYQLLTDDEVLATEPDEKNQFIEDVPSFKQSIKTCLPKAIKDIFEYWKDARKNALSRKTIRGDGPPPEMFRQQKEERRYISKNLPKIGRNEPCFCGSGIKFKKCCGSPERVIH